MKTRQLVVLCIVLSLAALLPGAALSSPAGLQQAKLTAIDGAELDFFGWSVAISGETVVVAAPWDDEPTYDWGSAYAFVRSSGSWDL